MRRVMLVSLFSVFFVVVVAGITGAALVLGGDGSSDDTLSAAKNAWKRISASNRTARFKWQEKRLYKKGSLWDGKKDLQGSEFRKGTVIPPNDHIATSTRELIWDGDLLRYEANEETYSVRHKGFTRSSYASSFNGKANTMLRQPGAGQAEVDIFDSNERLDQDQLLVRALFLALRPSDVFYSQISFDDLSLVLDDAFVEREKCICLGIERGRGVSDRYFISPTMGYHILRYTRTLYGHPQLSVDIKYTSLRDQWIPSAWTAQSYRYPDNTVDTSLSATVIDYSIGGHVEKAAFDVTIPDDALISDHRTGYVLPRSDWDWLAILVVLCGLLLIIVRVAVRYRSNRYGR